ncbi:MAG: laccase domain-containing protein [Planctomycetota bacterium]|nr:MAG: laccase domain-containing protein [Planctomycetota bacterium]
MREQFHHSRIGLAFEGLSRDRRLRHVFTTRNREGGGNLSLSGGRDRAGALNERRFWSQWLEAPAEDWVVGGQVHQANLAVVEPDHRGRGALDPSEVLKETDGLLTSTPGLPLYVAVADCAAVLLFAPAAQPWMGIVHAGWRGLRDGILERAVTRLNELSDCPAESMQAGISPCIGLSHFEVGDEVAEHAPDRRRLRFHRNGKWHVDLSGWANDQLTGAGLIQGSVEGAGLDTFERPDLFFSHRRDGEKAGRNGLIAMLCPPPEPPEGPRF